MGIHSTRRSVWGAPLVLVRRHLRSHHGLARHCGSGSLGHCGHVLRPCCSPDAVDPAQALLVKRHPPFDEDAWRRERQREAAGEILACPDCGSSAWFHPIGIPPATGAERKYRACKNCGFWQEADGTAAYRTWLSTHTCIIETKSKFACQTCGQRVAPNAEGSAVHHCGKYLCPDEEGYTCGTCGKWLGRDTSTPWASVGSG